ncbi:hypothetical protein PGT21_017282 [Puccinia graminis f. sp. tritici]|uniref:CCHC-type domain-containing protein n=1 Tax=Puccinia graminis f. sp. tritici TaxID=56615 RepID=A0A5B0PYA1_PUCGR|nr:hypothetical protein PGT21_017282 [Puccinia graminis f. sp. tritici]
MHRFFDAMHRFFDAIPIHGYLSHHIASFHRCYNCGERGHHSSRCPKPQKKNKATTQGNGVAARAGAKSTVPLGCYGSEDEENDDDSFDDEIDVVWG